MGCGDPVDQRFKIGRGWIMFFLLILDEFRRFFVSMCFQHSTLWACYVLQFRAAEFKSSKLLLVTCVLLRTAKFHV